MVLMRATTTNEVVLGCMLDSLVCNGEVSRPWRCSETGGRRSAATWCSAPAAGRLRCLAARASLRKSNLGVALKYTGVMHSQGLYVPPCAVSLLFKVAAEVDRVQAVVEACLDGTIMMPHETITFAFEDCPRRGDLVLTSCIEAFRRCGGELPAILEQVVSRLRPQGRVVQTLVTLETLAEVLGFWRRDGWVCSVTELQVNRSVPIGDMFRLEALNPVFIVSVLKV
jgi:hypothetical protein